MAMIGPILLILITMSVILAGMLIHVIFTKSLKSRRIKVMVLLGAILFGIISFLALYVYGNSLISLPNISS
ncbi:MAG: hypothetical protein ACYC27_23355 [Armatimonadota bacterium]